MTDRQFMKIAIELAKKGIGSVEPNPAVGCVIVKGGKVIGQSWHKKYGGHHAEVNTITDCIKKGESTKDATMYVTLEPCCHWGKTPPCTDAVIASKVAKVVIAMTDPSKHAAGKGIKLLKKAGIKVAVGVLKNEAENLNAPFVKFAKTAKPWIILKWAQSLDAKLASKKKSQRWISCEKSRADVQNIRRRVQAIIVGINTAIEDDPLLTVRPAKQKPPMRIVLDSDLKIPLNSKLFKTIGQAPVLIVTSNKSVKSSQPKFNKILAAGAEILAVNSTKGRCDLNKLLEFLSERGIGQVLVEGGPMVLESFLKQKLADEVNIYISPKILGENGKADISKCLEMLSNSVQLTKLSVKEFGEDIRIRAFAAGK